MINKVILVGNVGADPEVRTLENGVKTARVRLATTERMFNPQTQEAREHTEWHTVTLWRGLADVADRYVRKGSQIYIEGSIRTREWVDRDNIKRFSTEILASDMKLLGRRSDNPSASQGQPYGQQSYGGGQPQQQPQQQRPQSTPSPAQPTQPSPAETSAEDVDDLPF